MRLFIALKLPENIQRELAFPGGSKPENLHITLKFLGECPEEKVAALSQALEYAVRGTGPFQASLGQPGTFPERGKPHSFWVGLKAGEKEVRTLAEKIETACEALGFAREKRPFVAHITLSRGKIPDPFKVPEQPFQIDSLALVRSILSPSGSNYTPLTTIAL